jgi:hypothetical protein
MSAKSLWLLRFCCYQERDYEYYIMVNALHLRGYKQLVLYENARTQDINNYIKLKQWTLVSPV